MMSKDTAAAAAVRESIEARAASSFCLSHLCNFLRELRSSASTSHPETKKEMPGVPRPKRILIKIDGVTTDRKYITETMLPFAMENAGSFLEEKWAEENVMSLISYLRKESDMDPKAPAIKNQTMDDARLLRDTLSYIKYLLEQDVPTKGRQMLFLMVWGDGYERKALTSSIFVDVADAMYCWHKMSIPMSVFSGGNKTANKMIFTFSYEGGNLDKFVSEYLDAKDFGTRDNEGTYERVAEHFSLRTKDLLLLTDSLNEGRAARNANCQVVIMRRPGNASLTDAQVQDINCKVSSSFLDITFYK